MSFLYGTVAALTLGEGPEGLMDQQARLQFESLKTTVKLLWDLSEDSRLTGARLQKVQAAAKRLPGEAEELQHMAADLEQVQRRNAEFARKIAGFVAWDCARLGEHHLRRFARLLKHRGD